MCHIKNEVFNSFVECLGYMPSPQMHKFPYNANHSEAIFLSPGKYNLLQSCLLPSQHPEFWTCHLCFPSSKIVLEPFLPANPSVPGTSQHAVAANMLTSRCRERSRQQITYSTLVVLGREKQSIQRSVAEGEGRKQGRSRTKPQGCPPHNLKRRAGRVAGELSCDIILWRACPKHSKTDTRTSCFELETNEIHCT